MEINKKQIQCVAYYQEPHPLHKSWMKSLSSKKILSSLPKEAYFGTRYGIRKMPLLSQLVSIFYGISFPSAKIYFIEGAAIASSLFLKRGKVICINSDPFFYNLKKAPWFVRLYSKLLLKRIDGFISTSQMMHNQATKPSEIVYPFIEKTELFKINPKFENNNICNTAGVRYTKGTDIILEVYKKYKKIKPESELYVLGKDRNDKYWMNEVKKVGGKAPGRVNIFPYMNNSGIYLNTSRYEPFGINILESMAAGIPPLVSEHCGATEIVRKLDKNLIIPLNSEEIIKKIKWLKSDKKRFYELSKKSKIIAKTFTKERSYKELNEKFIKILKRIK